MHIEMPMNGLRRNNDAMKNKCRYLKKVMTTTKKNT